MSNPLNAFLPTAQNVITNYQKQILDRKSKLERLVALLVPHVPNDGVNKSIITDLNNAKEDEKKNYFNCSKLELRLESSIRLLLIIVCTTDIKTGAVTFSADNVPTYNSVYSDSTKMEGIAHSLMNALQQHFNNLNKGAIDEDEVYKMIW